MGNFDGSHKLSKTADEFHKKHENINMQGQSINNLQTICINQSSNLKTL